MKTIEQGLDEAYKKAGENAYFANGFKAGVEFAQRWIPIEESSPKDFQVVLVRNKHNSIRSLAIYEAGKFICDFLLENEDITHWRLIEIN